MKQMPRLVFHGFSLRTRSLLGRSRYKNVSPRGMCVRRCMQTLICVLAMCFVKRLDYLLVGSGELQCKGPGAGCAGSAASQGDGLCFSNAACASPLCWNCLTPTTHLIVCSLTDGFDKSRGTRSRLVWRAAPCHGIVPHVVI